MTLATRGFSQQSAPRRVYPTRPIALGRFGIGRPTGLVYDSGSDSFIVLERGAGGASMKTINRDRELTATRSLPAGWLDPLNATLDPVAHHLFALDAAAGRIREVPIDADAGSGTAVYDVRALAIAKPRGMSFDPVGRRLFILDGRTPRVITVYLSEGGRTEVLPLSVAAPAAIAFNPETAHLYVLAPLEQRLHELDSAGRVIASYDVAELPVADPQAMLFAPSVDPTDPPSRHDAVLLDRGRLDGNGSASHQRIVEFSIARVSSAAAGQVTSAPLVRIVLTSAWTPASPDPSGVKYLPGRNSLLVVDGDVEEANMAWLFRGKNVWESSLDGRVLNTGVTLPWSDEPTEAAQNGRDSHVFVSDDDAFKVFEIDPGGDGMLGTDDDTVLRSIRTKPRIGDPPSDLNCIDPEGIAFDTANQRLFISDGDGRELWIVDLGANGILDGPPNSIPHGDDIVTHFDTEVLGITDPEGVDLNPEKGTVWFISSGFPAKKYAYEVSLGGQLLRTLDITAAKPVKPAGVAYGPGSQDSRKRSLYIVDRGTDNDTDPTENDGRMYEFDLGWGPPGPPSGLTATILSSTQVALVWSNGSQTPFDMYRIERSLDGSATFVEIGTVDSTATAYVDASVPPAPAYDPVYRVRAANSNGYSDYSNLASAGGGGGGQLPLGPTDLIATAADPGRISVVWTDNSSNESGFLIERSADGSTFETLAPAAVNATSYTDTSPLPATTYFYRVSAFNAAGRSSPSNVASAAVSQIAFAPAADANIKLDYPTTNFGAETTLNADADPVKQALLKFTVSGVLGKIVTQASLRLWVDTDGSVSGGSVYRVANNAWTETGVTWNTAPAPDPTPVATLGRVSAGVWYAMDLTGLITGDGTYSLLLKTDYADGVAYSSKEGANSPQLVVTVQDSSSNAVPIGAFEEVRPSDGMIRGWAYDPDTSAVSAQLQIYADGPSGQGALLTTTTTTAPRTDINSAYGITGTHGFEYLVPPRYRDNVSHTLYVYAVDSTNASIATLLPGSPRSFTLTPPTTAPFRFSSWGDAQDGGTASYVTSNKIAGLVPAFTIFNGDLSDHGVVLDPATSPYSMQIMANALRGNPDGLGGADNGVFVKTFLERGNHDNENANPGDWQAFFTSYPEAQGTMADRVARIGGREYSYMRGQDDLTYSFDYGNSRFLLVDAPGDSERLTADEVAWIDQRLTDAEASHPELVHAFLSFHGPLYCVGLHCSCAGQRPSCHSSAADSLVAVLNKHPMVTALFHGHEHNLGWTHLDATRISDLTRPVEQFLTSPAGQDTNNSYVQFDANGVPYRFDYVETSIEDRAFGMVDVSGSSYYVGLYRESRTDPVWSGSFVKSAATTPPEPPITLSATAVSSAQIDLAWTNTDSNAYAIHIDRSLDNGATWSAIVALAGFTTAYSDTALMPGTTASYRLRATNPAGDSPYSNTASATTAQVAPAAPAGLTATVVDSAQVNLAWTESSAVNGFTVERSPDGVNFTPLTTIAGTATTYSDTGLTPLTTYYYRVYSFNSAGDSEFSNVASATTGVAPPAAPGALTAAAGSATQIDLAWTDNSYDEEGFRIERSNDGTTFTAVAEIAVNVTTYNDVGLPPATTFFYRVYAYNAGGNSGYSNTATGSTAQAPPAQPTNLTAAALNSSQIDLAWTDNSNNESGFEIERSSDGASFATLATTAANTSAFSDTGLPPATMFWYRVRAVNTAGASLWSDTVSATTSPVPPAPPSSLTAAAVGSDQIHLAWTDNSNNEDGFAIERSFDGTSFVAIHTAPADTQTYDDTGLNAGTLYYYRIKAISTASGDSGYSNLANATTGQIPPPAPTGLRATAAGSSRITLDWTDAANNEDGFKVERSSDGETFAQIGTVAANVVSYDDFTVAAGSSYYYRVRAYNTAGDSEFSNTASATTAQVPPAAPTSLTATASGSSQVNLTWSESSAAVDGFYVERSEDGLIFAPLAAVAGTERAYGDSGLAASTTYYYRVRAFNPAGNSDYSNVASATTAQVPPAAPSGLTATAAGSSQINLTWLDNSTNEQGFRLERSADGTTFAELATLTANATSYGDTGLTPATMYYYRVRAFNSAGDSGYSNIASASTGQVPPAAPTNLTAVAVGSSQVNLAWVDNANNESGFRIERSPDNITFAQVAIVGADITAYDDTGLTAATTYYYRVRASNAAGDSAASNVASATTAQVPPDAPTDLTAAAVSGSQINLAWTDNSANESGFEIERSSDGVNFIQIATVTANIRTYSNTGLNPATTYSYRVRAYNGAGASAYSNIASATTPQVVPAAPSNLSAKALNTSQIALTWRDQSSNESGFYVERSTNGQALTQIASVGADTTTYTDSGLAAGTKYMYRVQAYNSAGASAYSNTANATTPKR